MSDEKNTVAENRRLAGATAQLFHVNDRLRDLLADLTDQLDRLLGAEPVQGLEEGPTGPGNSELCVLEFGLGEAFDMTGAMEVQLRRLRNI